MLLLYITINILQNLKQLLYNQSQELQNVAQNAAEFLLTHLRCLCFLPFLFYYTSVLKKVL